MPTKYSDIKHLGWTYGDLKRFTYAQLKVFFDNYPLSHLSNLRPTTHSASHRDPTHSDTRSAEHEAHRDATHRVGSVLPGKVHQHG